MCATMCTEACGYAHIYVCVCYMVYMCVTMCICAYEYFHVCYIVYICVLQCVYVLVGMPICVLFYKLKRAALRAARSTRPAAVRQCQTAAYVSAEARSASLPLAHAGGRSPASHLGYVDHPHRT